MFLERLPDVLLSELVYLWIELKEVAKFDSSLTNRKNRPVFLNILSGGISFTYEKPCDKLIRWLKLRDVKLNYLDISIPFTPLDVTKLPNCSKVQKIRINSGRIALLNHILLINHCPVINSLNFISTMVMESEAENLTVLQNLLKPTKLIEINYLRMEFLKYFGTKCGKLEHVELWYFSFPHLDSLLMLLDNNKNIKTLNSAFNVWLNKIR